MSISSEIAPYLPQLRRFSRALSGNQESGDAYVVALLESFVATPAAFPRDIPPRIALYRSFIRMWGSIALTSKPSETESPVRTAADRLLTSITPVPRQAFLLVTMEGFTPAEAAQILSIDPPALAKLIEAAGEEIAEEIGADVLIIEDEPLIAIDLENLVRELGHRVQAVARTEREALALAEAHQPSLVLADIQLADGSSGLSAARKIMSVSDVPVIFITAFPERLLTGERPEPTFLISKPFQTETVKAVICQALFMSPHFDRNRSRTGATLEKSDRS